MRTHNRHVLFVRFRFALVVLYLMLAFAVPAFAADQKGSITVDAQQIQGPVNKLVFGFNLEAADNARIFDGDVTDMLTIQTGNGYWDPRLNKPVPKILDQCKAVGMSMLRYPGGCLAHNYDWRKSVGPDAKKNGWTFGLDEYLALCRAIGAEPIIIVSDYVLPAEQMPENAAELVEYLNSPAQPSHPWAMKRKAWGHAEPYGVTWFELGNESYHGNHRVLPRRQYTPEQYAAYANATAAAMRKVDPKVRIGIVMVPGPATDVESDWNRTVVRLAGKSADFIVVHLYAPLADGATEAVRMQATMAVGEQSEHHLAEYHRMVQREAGRDLPIAVTEYNGYLGQDRFNYGQALESADLVRVFLKPELKIASADYWQFLNGFFGMIRAPRDSATGEPQTLEPAFPLYRLWGEHFGSQLVKVEAQGPLATFAGAGSVAPAFGSSFVERRQIEQFTTQGLSSSLFAKVSGIQLTPQGNGFDISVHNLNRSAYPTLAHFARPHVQGGTPVEFAIEFDARFTPSDGSAAGPLGVGLLDSRGWNQTHSGVAVDGVTTDWKHFQSTYQLAADTSNVDLTVRLQGDNKPLSGTLQVRNLKIAAYVSAHYPAYSLLTASASLSADRKTLYLMVFNKSEADSIAASISVEGFRASKALLWEVTGPELAATQGVQESAHGVPISLKGGSVSAHVFPARSMTAIELSKSSGI